MSGKELNPSAPSFMPGGNSGGKFNSQGAQQSLPMHDGGGRGSGGPYNAHPYAQRGGRGSDNSNRPRRGGQPPFDGGMMSGNMAPQYMNPGYAGPPPPPSGSIPMGGGNYQSWGPQGNYGHHNTKFGPAVPMGNDQYGRVPPPGQPPRTGLPRSPQQQQQLKQRSVVASPMPLHASPPAAATPTMRADPPAPVCKVIMVIGYRGSGKTTVAQSIAKVRDYEYVNMNGATEDTKEAEASNDRLLVLDDLLRNRKAQLKGIVLDDVIVRSRFEAHYVNTILRGHNLSVTGVVILTPSLSALIARDPTLYNTPDKKAAHPECFELASRLEDATPDAPIVIVDNEGTLEEVISDVEAQLKAIESKPVVAVQFPPVELMNKCPLVTEPKLVDKIINAETEVLAIKNGFGFPYVEPNYLLDYPVFARSAIQFQSYMVVPWVWGDKVSIIGYEDGVYVHLPSFRLVFKLMDSVLPTPMVELMKKLHSERELNEAGSPVQPIMFSLEASMLEDALYISDMMLIGSTLGSKTLLPDRVKLLRSELGKLPQSGAIRLLEHFPVQDIEKCLSSCPKARGLLFVNPDGMMVGHYDSRNFLYPLETIKTVRLRLWNGRADGARWLFDAYTTNEDDEVPVDVNDENVLAVIMDSDVEALAINDGHIVECVLTTDTAAAPATTKGARRGAQKQVSTFTFEKRCRWERNPITLFYQKQFSENRPWTTAKLSSACATIAYTPARVPNSDL